VRAIAVDGDRVLFGTDVGKLVEYKNGAWDVFGSSFFDIKSGIYTIALSPTGGIWVGTNGDGIVGIEDSGSMHITMEDGLPSNMVRSIAFRGETLWAACYGGVAEISFPKP
ncbi:MAG: hypothetical protein J7M24_03540, partial [Candidatus Latescibacteria bacterium]|nr:hypothetical protein [Candidatus Latescibacterota bacterium]